MVAVVKSPLLRGTIEGANCAECPFVEKTTGRALRPVFSEYPENPAWIVVGEGPGMTEVQNGRPMVGPTGQLVNKILAKIGRPREEIFVGNATACIPPRGSPPEQRDQAARCCAPRLRRELAQWPGIPVLTLGSVAAHALIPQEALDAIDPPDVPKTKKRDQKARQRAEARALAKAGRDRARAIEKIAKRRFKEKVKYRREQVISEMMRPTAQKLYQRRKRPTKDLIDRTIARDLAALQKKADIEAIREWSASERTRELAIVVQTAHPPKPKKPKPKKIKITDIAGSCFVIDVDGTGSRPLIPAIHPAALLHGGGATIGGTHTPDLAFVNLVYDAGKVNAIAQGKDIWLRLNVDTETKDATRAAQMLVDIVWEAIAEGEISIDLETYVDDPERHHALMAYMAKIRAIGLATSERTISIMWDLVPPWARSIFQMMLAHPRVTKTFHNGLYDRTVLANEHNAFSFAGPYEDTLLAHHAAFPGCAHRLQVVTCQLFATPAWKSEFRNAEETPEGLTTYNAKDTGATHALRPQLTIMVKKTMTEGVYALDKKMAEIASKMHLAGMPVSREVNSELLRTFTKNVIDSRRAVEAMAEDPKNRELIHHHLARQQAQKKRKADPDSFERPDGTIATDFDARYWCRRREIELDPKWKWKIGGGKHIAALLQALGVQLHQVTDTGQISTKKDILESLAHVPVVRDILTFRENDKLLSTFIWSIFDRFNDAGDQLVHGFADDRDRIHPIWSIHAITGRWRAGEPNCQNVPKDKFKRMPDGTKKILRPNLRTQIVAPPGRIFIGFDFGQLEARVIALISGDPFLCQVFAEGKDIHKECARVVFRDFDKLHPDDQKKARDETKNFEYGAFYGGSVETLWKTLLKQGNPVKLVDVAKAVSLLMQRMAGVVAWQRDCVLRASEPPFEIREFLLGRRRTFPLGQVEPTEAMNFGVQSAGASIMNTGMARMDARLSKYRQALAIAQIHDAAVFEAWEDDADKIAADVRECFTQEYERGGRLIPFPVEVKVGRSWADV